MKESGKPLMVMMGAEEQIIDDPAEAARRIPPHGPRRARPS